MKRLILEKDKLYFVTIDYEMPATGPGSAHFKVDGEMVGFMLEAFENSKPILVVMEEAITAFTHKVVLAIAIRPWSDSLIQDMQKPAPGKRVYKKRAKGEATVS